MGEIEGESDGEDVVEMSLDDPGAKSLLKSQNSQRPKKKVSKRSKAETVVSSGCVLTDSMMNKHVGDTSDLLVHQGEVSHGAVRVRVWVR